MNNGLPVIGEWVSTGGAVYLTPDRLPAAIAAYRSPAFVVRDGPAGSVGVGIGGAVQSPARVNCANGIDYPCLGILPALYPEWLGCLLYTSRCV